MKDAESKIGKWSVVVELKDGSESRVYCHRTTEEGLEAECVKFFGDKFVKIVFKERLK